MSFHDMSVFSGGRRVNLNLFTACIYYTVASSSVETPSEGSCLQAIFFQTCYEYKVRLQVESYFNYRSPP